MDETSISGAIQRQGPEKAIAWLVSLTERPFGGTESRLLTLFVLLEQISAGTEADPVKRVEDLRQKRDPLFTPSLNPRLAELVLAAVECLGYQAAPTPPSSRPGCRDPGHGWHACSLATKKLGDSLHRMTLGKRVRQNSPDPYARLKASLMTPDKIESSSTRYTMYI